MTPPKPDRPPALANDLAALIGSRICHDLISPIGAIGNGVELLMMELQRASPEAALIAESVANANARIRFFRLAYGRAEPGQRIARNEVVSILTDWTQGARLTVDWSGPAEMSRAQARLLFLLIQCLDSAMPHGGRIQVRWHDPGWTLSGEAARFRALPVQWALLGAPDLVFAALPDIPPAEVQFPLAALALQTAGTVAHLTQTEGAITLSV
jgi:histidine phosphotransferase ChpT